MLSMCVLCVSGSLKFQKARSPQMMAATMEDMQDTSMTPASKVRNEFIIIEHDSYCIELWDELMTDCDS